MMKNLKQLISGLIIFLFFGCSTSDQYSEEITKADLNYYRTKLNRARTTQGIDDPRIARNKFINNVVYIKQNNKYLLIFKRAKIDESSFMLAVGDQIQ